MNAQERTTAKNKINKVPASFVNRGSSNQSEANDPAIKITKKGMAQTLRVKIEIAAKIKTRSATRQTRRKLPATKALTATNKIYALYLRRERVSKQHALKTEFHPHSR